MARITVGKVYGGAKYDAMSAMMTEYLKDSRTLKYDEWPGLIC